MGWFFLLPYFTFHLFLLLTHFPSYTHSWCSHHDSSALLKFKNSFVVSTSYDYDECDSSSFTSKTESWKNGTDCCKWDGVSCNNLSGHVIGLDLSCGRLEGKLYPNSTIFQLRHLQKLNLAFNSFFGSSIHSGIGDLVNLTHLNLSYSGIGGDIPPVISHLSKLVSISLGSDEGISMILDPFTWQKLILNATNLRELHLYFVNMSSITGSSLSLLMNLSSSLVSLTLSGNEMQGLQGNFPNNILSLPNLQELDLSYNNHLSVQLPKSNWSTPLRYLDLSSTASSGEIPNSIGHLKSLNQLVLDDCHFVGLIPPSLWNLTQMTYLSLSVNNFQGEIPSLLSNLIHLTSFNLGNNNFNGPIPDVFGKLIKLEILHLSFNNLVGPIPSSLSNLTQLSFLHLSSNNLVGPIPNEITKHSKLVFLGLSGNMLNGTIPQWCYSLPSLEYLFLEDNRFTGLIGEFSTFSLKVLYLSNNKLQGDFPISIFKLENLFELRLSSNSLSGLVDFHQFSNLQKLESLDLSKNSFHFNNNTNNSPDYILPNLKVVFLSSSNISSFPIFLKALPSIQKLDLSNNKIQGEIPKWFHRKLLNSGEISIDLSFNKFQGDLPILPNGIRYFFASNNNFTGDIASTLCNASSLSMLNLAHNNLSGMIPQCLGSFPSLSMLNLAHNNLTGMIPQCLGSLTYLSVLDLQVNNLIGRMPRNFSKENAFETIKLNGNHLEGPLPHSLAHCTNLEVLDLADNIIEDVFPNWLETLQELQVLSLRSNKLHGAITCSSMKHLFPNLRIFDLSNNNFSGPLPTSCIKNFQGMVKVNDSQTDEDGYYDDSVVVIIKGISEELTRILTTFTTIDLSNNMFEGEIPGVIGELHSLKGLNLSHNGITGTIPHSLSNLTNLEWLDLSRNKLMGEIPVALTNLNFLSKLNLSQNQLEGMIPTGKQFDTFGNDSYEGNPLLCGLPLSKSCKNDEERPPYSKFDDEEDSGDSGFGWKAVVIGYACGAVFGVLMGYNVLLTGRPQWLARLVESVFNTTLRRAKKKRVNGNRRGMN